MKNRVTVIVAVTVLVLGCLAVALGERIAYRHSFAGSLTTILPTAEQLPGWSKTEREIADTDEMKSLVEKTLRYDDALYWSYEHGSRTVSIYAAYWRPGGMSQHEVAAHVPDVCWVGNGWRQRAKDRVTIRSSSGTPVSAEVRTFTIQGHTEAVIYWHLAAGESVHYEREGSRRPATAYLRDLLRHGLGLRREQVFVRISSPGASWKEIPEEVVRAVLDQMQAAGLLAANNAKT